MPDPERLLQAHRQAQVTIDEHLPALVRTTRREGRTAIWSIDPMHGNTRSAGRFKTRRVGDIVAEIRGFFEIAKAEGVHPGGADLEMTGANVTECVNGSLSACEDHLAERYLTHCDPRLNYSQAIEVAAVIARLMDKAALAASNAA